MFNYDGIEIEIRTSTLMDWIEDGLRRTKEKLTRREAEFQQQVADPAVAAQMIEDLASGHDLYTTVQAVGMHRDAKAQIAVLAATIKDLKWQIKTFESYLVGLRCATNHEVDLPLSVVADLAPRD